MNSYQLKLAELERRVLAIEKSKIEKLPESVFELKLSKRETNARRILALLQQDCRMQLTEMSGS